LVSSYDRAGIKREYGTQKTSQGKEET